MDNGVCDWSGFVSHKIASEVTKSEMRFAPVRSEFLIMT